MNETFICPKFAAGVPSENYGAIHATPFARSNLTDLGGGRDFAIANDYRQGAKILRLFSLRQHRRAVFDYIEMRYASEEVSLGDNRKRRQTDDRR